MFRIDPFRKFLLEDTPSNGVEMTWLQKKGEHMISASALASPQQGWRSSDRT